jgi:8-oxo-dGTP pyrophosphatase MutT (NUDIX family)
MRKIGKGQVEVLLVSSRDTGRWIIPKGWPSRRLSDPAAAAREARQEAGVRGKITAKPVGTYRYRKIEPASSRLIEVTVYPLLVKKEKKRWPEKAERRRRWLAPKLAAKYVRERKLRSLIASLES